MRGWSRDLRRGDLLELQKRHEGLRRVRYQVRDLLSQPPGWELQMVGAGGGPVGKPVPYSHSEVEDEFLPPQVDNPHHQYGTRAMLLVQVVSDDGSVSEQPWVEGAECPLDSFEGATFEYLGQVDSRAAGLPPEELWAHRDELVSGKYRFMGAGGVLRPEPKATTTRRIRRFRGR